jgi:hypothetical protein
VYNVSGPDEFAGQVFYDVHMHTRSGTFHVVSYPTELKAEVAANFLNVLDQIEDDDTEQLDEINGFLGF